MAFNKKHAIRDLQSKDTAQDIDENFDAIFQALRALQSQVSEASTGDGVVGADGLTIIGPPGEDGPEGDQGPQGLPGLQGVQGPAGPPTQGPMGMDGLDGDEGMPIPGPTGPTGATGATGGMGPVTLGPMYVDETMLDDSIIQVFPTTTSGSAFTGWTLVEARAMASNATEDFTGLSAYSSVLVVCHAVTKSVSGILQLRVSTDNGATFLTASGDYLIIAGSGTGSVATAIDLHNANATAARYGFALLLGFSKTGVKTSFGSATNSGYIIPTTTALNAVRVTSSGVGATLDAGTIYVFGQ